MFLALALFAFSLPSHLDYGNVKKGRCENSNETYWNVGALAFNGAPELSTLFAYLKRTYNIDTVVETGTFQGNTTVFFSHLFDEVHTIEIAAETHRKIKEKFSSSSNIHCHLGSSDVVLKDLLPSIGNKPILFYLDAHVDIYWPLRIELIEISKTHRDNCIIVIDDFQVPRTVIPYDRYGPNACSYSYIKDQLDKVYSEYTFHYIIPNNPLCRAKFLVIPTSFQKN